MTPCISSCTENTTKQYTMVTPFLAHIMVKYLLHSLIYMFFSKIYELHLFRQVEQTNKIYLSTQRFISNMTLPCEWIKSVDNQNENRICTVPLDNSNRSFTSESESIESNPDLIWKEVLSSDERISKLRTWESLGAPEFSKQSLFVTDLPESALHLARIRQTSILSLLPKKVKTTIPAEIYYAKIVLLCYRQCIPCP